MGLTLKKLSLMPYIVYLAFFSLDIGRLPVLKRPTESSIYLEVFVLFVVVYSKGFFFEENRGDMVLGFPYIHWFRSFDSRYCVCPSPVFHGSF